MSLSDEQFAFLQDLIKLYQHAIEQGYKITLGESYRTLDQQKLYFQSGLSKTMQSQHLKRLAQDLNFFKDGQLIQTKKELQAIGDYWESLDRKNRWGGNFSSFVDCPHFERYA